jgi:hypothetical protein
MTPTAPTFRDALQLRVHIIGEWITTEANGSFLLQRQRTRLGFPQHGRDQLLKLIRVSLAVALRPRIPQQHR